MGSISKKYLSYKLVFSGKDRVEVFAYDKPINVDFERNADIVHRADSDDYIRRDDNVYRSRRAVRQIIWSNLTDHTKLLTLTCSETCLDVNCFMRMLQTFFQSMKRSGFKLRYVYVLEHQLKRGEKEGNSGSWHAHIVIFNDEYIPLEVLNKAWKYGYTDLHILDGLKLNDKDRVRDAGAYICKYITKNNCTEFKSRVFRCSLGLDRPVEVPVYAYRMDNDTFVSDPSQSVYIDLINQLNISYSSDVPICFIDKYGELHANVCHYMQGSFKKNE